MIQNTGRIQSFADFKKISGCMRVCRSNISKTANSYCYIVSINNQSNSDNHMILKKYKPHVQAESVIREYNMLSAAAKINNAYEFFPKPVGIYQQLNTYYLLYNYIEGTTGEICDQQLEPTTETILPYIKTLLLITRSLHLRNITHLDIKPANCIYNRNDYLSFIDFGTSRWLDYPGQRRMIRTNNKLGSPYYAAPEAYDCEYNCTSDVYSIGKIFQDHLARLKTPDPRCVELCHDMLHHDPTVRIDLKNVLQNNLFSLLNKANNDRCTA